MVVELLAQESALLSVDIVRRAKLAGYRGGKSALYDLIQAIRPKTPRPLVRFEGLPGEFSQHDFGQVDVRIAHRQQTRLDRLVRRARFPFLKTIEDFNFAHESIIRLSFLGSALAPDFVTDGRCPILSEALLQPARISGIEVPEFPEPTGV